MRRKTNDKLLIIAVLIVAASLVLQTFVLRSITKKSFEAQSYEKIGYLDKDAYKYSVRLPKEIMDRKFSAFKHVTDYGSTLNYFTLLQFEDFEKQRKSGVRNVLTVDDVLYIVEDSIDAYFSYKRVVFTGESAQTTAGGVLYYSVGFPDSYSSYDELYSIVLSHISQIICYRLLIHDAGFMRAYHSSNGVLEIFNETGLSVGNGTNYYTAMLIDEGSLADDAYKSRLGTKLLEYITNVDPESVKDAKDHDSILFYSPALSVTDSTDEIIMWDTMTYEAIRLFPTISLEEMINEKLGIE